MHRATEAPSPQTGEAALPRLFVRILVALWLALSAAAVLAWVALRSRAGPLPATVDIAFAIAADAAIAAGLAWILYQLAKRWGERRLTLAHVLGRVAFFSVAALLSIYGLTALFWLLNGMEPSEVADKFGRSGLGIAADLSFFWAIAITVVPIPFIRALAPRPAQLDRLEVRSTGAVEYVAVADVLAVVAAENYVELVLAHRSILHRATLTQMTVLLGSDFVRAHRSVLLRRTAIAAIEREEQRQFVRLSNGRRLSLAKAYRAAVTGHTDR